MVETLEEESTTSGIPNEIPETPEKVEEEEKEEEELDDEEEEE